MRRFLIFAAALLSPALASAAPHDLVGEPIVLDRGEVLAEVVVEADLAQLATPLSLAPDAWVGVTSRLTVGITHSNAALGRVDDGASLCVVTSDLSCTTRYHGGALDVRWAATDDIAPRARVIVRDTDPFKPALGLGALVRWQRGRFALAGDPYLQLGLDNTDRGNRAALVVPLYATVQPGCAWALTFQTGYESDLAVARDGFHVPIALSARARVAPHLELTLGAGFTSLLGPQNNAKQRSAWLVLSWRS